MKRERRQQMWGGGGERGRDHRDLETETQRDADGDIEKVGRE